jgi:hypothetical protein
MMGTRYANVPMSAPTAAEVAPRGELGNDNNNHWLTYVTWGVTGATFIAHALFGVIIFVYMLFGETKNFSHDKQAFYNTTIEVAHKEAHWYNYDLDINGPKDGFLIFLVIWHALLAGITIIVWIYMKCINKTDNDSDFNAKEYTQFLFYTIFLVIFSVYYHSSEIILESLRDDGRRLYNNNKETFLYKCANFQAPLNEHGFMSCDLFMWVHTLGLVSILLFLTPILYKVL